MERSESNSHVPKDDEAVAGAPSTFRDAESLLDYATTHWKENWVTTDIWDENVLDVLIRRPFFLLISVEAPVSVRWERFRAR